MEQFIACMSVIYVLAIFELSQLLWKRYRKLGGIQPLNDEDPGDENGNEPHSNRIDSKVFYGEGKINNVNPYGLLKSTNYWKKITIRQFLHSEEISVLRNQFPGLNIKFTNESKEGHAFSHAFRMLERRKMLIDLGIVGTTKMLEIVRADGYDYEYIDVGGRITHQITDNIDSAHTETPMLSSRDIARIENDRNQLLNMYNKCKMGFFKQNLKKIEEGLRSYSFFQTTKDTSKNIWCHKRSQDCKATAPNLVFLHSVYDMSSVDILNIFKAKNALRGMATLYFDFNMLNPKITKGEIKYHNCIWEKKEGNIIFYFRDDYSHCYIHNLDNYLDKFRQTRLVSKDGRQVIDVEIVQNECGIAWLKYTALPSIAANFESNTRVLQNSGNNDKVEINYFKPVYNHLGQYTRKLKTASMIINREYVNKVLSEILRTDQGRFTITSVVNIVTTFNNNIMINGADIIKKTELDAMENFELAHALFVYAFIYKMEQHNLSALLTARIKEVRGMNESRWSFLYKILDFIPYFSRQVTLLDMDLSSFKKYILDVKSVFLECEIDVRQLTSTMYVKSDNRTMKARNTKVKLVKKEYDFSNSKAYAKQYKENVKVKYTCDKVFADNINVPGDGDCGLYSYKHVSGDTTEPVELRKQIMDYAAKNKQVADITGKNFLSFFDMKILAKLKGYNLCLHDGVTQTRYFVDHECDDTFHVHFENNHFTPVEEEDTEVPVEDVITSDGVICASDEGVRFHMDVNFMQDDGQTGGYVVLAFYVWLLSYVTKLPPRYSVICVFVYHFISLYIEYVLPFSIQMFESVYWLFLYMTILIYVYKCYRYDHLDRFNIWLRVIIFVILYSVSGLVVLSLVLMLTFDYLMIKKAFHNYYYFLGMFIVLVCRFTSSFTYLLIDVSSSEEYTYVSDMTIRDLWSGVIDNWFYYHNDGYVFSYAVPLWSYEGFDKLIVEPMLDTKVSVFTGALAALPGFFSGIFFGGIGILLVPFVFVYNCIVSVLLFLYWCSIWCLFACCLYLVWLYTSADSPDNRPLPVKVSLKTAKSASVRNGKQKADRLAFNKLYHARNKVIKSTERAARRSYEIDMSEDSLFDYVDPRVLAACHEMIPHCYGNCKYVSYNCYPAIYIRETEVVYSAVTGQPIQKDVVRKTHEESTPSVGDAEQQVEVVVCKTPEESTPSTSNAQQQTKSVGAQESKKVPEVQQEKKYSFEMIDIEGDLMTAGTSIAHCVSADFYMGKGIAATVRKMFGCLRGLAGMYSAPGVYMQEASYGLYVFHVITKQRYHDKPTLENYVSAITDLRDAMIDNGIYAISMPRLGCGLDHISENIFRDTIRMVFGQTDIAVFVYTLPESTPSDLVSVEKEDPKGDDASGAKAVSPGSVLKGGSSVITVADRAMIYTKRLEQPIVTREELRSMIRRAPKNVIVQSCVAPPRGIVVLCSECLDLAECKYYVSLDYQQKLPLELNEKLGTSIVYPPISTVAERFRNAVIERKHIADLTIKQIDHVHATIAKHLRTMKGNSFESKIINLQKLKEFKNVQISVYDATVQCFKTKIAYRHEYMVPLSTGIIKKVTWVRDRDSNQPVLKTRGILFTTNLLEIHNEPAIAKKLETIMAMECDAAFDVNMINGVPGCGKTTRAIRDFKKDYNTMIACATKASAADVRDRLAKSMKDSGADMDDDMENYLNIYVRTIDSVLVNLDVGKLNVKCLLVDEALMRHPGEIYALVRILNVRHLELIGDKAQIPFVNRVSDYMTVWHEYPLEATEHMSVSYRCPVDAVAAISKFYPVPVSSASNVERSMQCVRYVNFSTVPPPNKNTQVLVFKQSEKLELSLRWKCKVSTIHEFQGQQADSVMIVRLSDKPQEEIYLRDNYALVAITRHTKYCVYYTPVVDSIAVMIGGVPENVTPFKRSRGGHMVVSNRPVSSSSTCVFRPLTQAELERVSYNRPDLYILLTDDQRIALAVELGRGYDTVDIVMTDTDKATKSLLSGMMPPTTPLILDDVCEGQDYTNTLQGEFDRVLPANAHRSQMLDQLLVERSDLNLSLDNIKCRTLHVYDVNRGRDRRYDCLRPALNTSCPIRRNETDLEIFLGIQKRNANVPDVQGIVINEELAKAMCKNFIQVFMDPKKIYLLEEFRAHKIGNSERSTRMWAEAAGYSATYMRNPYLIDVMSLDFDRFNYSIKPVPKPVQTFAASEQYQALQTISAHKRYINAVFCPTIKEAKTRIKALLREKYMLFTDVSNEDFVKELNMVANPASLRNLIKHKQIYARELDISKYDKSQGYEATYLVCWLLKLVGCDPEIIDYYQICQRLVRCNSRKTGINFYMNYQMKSGVALTLFGNTLFTMATNALVYPDNKVIFATFCGDDAYYLLKKFDDPLPDKSSILSNVVNLEVKEFCYTLGYFCSKFLVMGATTWYFVPDPVKLLNKLGRFDIVSYKHAEEYRVSTADNYKVPTEECLFLVDIAISERYKVPSSNVNLILTLLKVINDPVSFSKLYFLACGDKPADDTVFRRDLSRD